MLKAKVVRANETKILDEATGRVSAVVSSERIDRDGDVIRASGWSLDHFFDHPIVIANHDYTNLESVIGTWEKMEVVGTKMHGQARFFIGKGNRQADWAFELAKEHQLAFSVGFIPDMSKASPLHADDALGAKGMEFKGQELLEVSAVTVPSNPDALQRMAKRITVDPVADVLVEERLADMPSNSIGEEQVEAIAVKVVALLKQMAPAEVEPEAEAEEPETPEPEESGQGDDGEAENAVEEFDPYAVAIAAAEAVLLEEEE
jgi:hypothetical protein